MATATPPTTDATPDPVDARIQNPLTRLRGYIRLYVVLEALAVTGIFLGLWFWIGLIFDYGIFRLTGLDWVQELPWGVRAAVSGTVALILTVILARVLFLRLFREFTNQSLALVLEQRFPKVFGDRLITAVELANVQKAQAYGYSPDMIKRTVQEARDRVDRVPISHAFNWQRLTRKAGWFAVILLVPMGLIFITGVILSSLTQQPVGRFTNQSQDVAMIWAERNLMLENVPWPRRVYLELVNFPNDERRIGRDGATPRVEVRAWRWVIADPSTTDGWRPITYGELTPDLLGGIDPPELPLSLFTNLREQMLLSTIPLAATGNPLAPALSLQLRPGDVGLIMPANLPRNLEETQYWRVDDLYALFALNERVKRYLARNLRQADAAAFNGLFEVLAERGTDPALSRRFRMLETPNEVRLEYWGKETSNEMTLKGVNQTYSGTLADLRESVQVRARAEDYVTDQKQITLVPPPRFASLARTEYAPAYLYHRPPSNGTAQSLRGLTQVVPNLAISLTGEQSLFEIDLGTELLLYGSADKDLIAARILPKPGEFPGVPTGTEPQPIELPLEEDRRSFQFAFTGPRAIRNQTEFEFELVDTDQVASKRLIQIQPVADQPPRVAMAIEVIRRVGSNYLCTPIAKIPFDENSNVQDDHGLNKVEYLFNYRQLEADAVVSARATVLTRLFLNAPSIVSPMVGFANAAQLLELEELLTITDQQQFERNEPLPAFTQKWLDQGKQDRILSVLRETLRQAPPAQAKQVLIRQFSFRDESIAFDLRDQLPDLAVPSGQIQPRYRIELAIRATDSNADALPTLPGSATAIAALTGVGPHLDFPDGQVAVNPEPIRLLIVSEAELLAEISKEEEKLVEKLDVVVNRLSDGEQKLNRLIEALPTLGTGETITPEATRAAEITETLNQTYEETQDLLRNYGRILREYRANRCNDKLIRKVDREIYQPLRTAVEVDYPAAQASMVEFNSAFQALNKPALDVARQTQQDYRKLLDSLQMVRDGITSVTTIKFIIEQLRKIEKEQGQLGQLLRQWIDAESRKLLAPKITQLPAPVLQVQETVQTSLAVNFGLSFEGELVLKFEPPSNSELQLPASLKINTDMADLIDDTVLEFAITAGRKKGQFPVKVIPSEGPTRTMTVTVK